MDILTTLIQKGASLKTLQEVSACLGGFAAPQQQQQPQQLQQQPQQLQQQPQQLQQQPQQLQQQPQQLQPTQLDRLEAAINRMSDLYEKQIAQAAAVGQDYQPRTVEDIATEAIAGLMQSEGVR